MMKFISRISWLFKTICAAGLLWQLVTIIDIYFHYHVLTATHVFTPEVIDPVAMTLCVRMDDVLDLNRIERDFNASFTKNEEGYIKEFRNLSLQTLFDYTPSKDIITTLVFKTKNNTRLKKHGKNIDRLVNITKFLHRTNVCYKVVVIGDEALEYREFSVTNEYQFHVKILKFNQSIENATSLKVLLGPIHHIPYKGLISNQQQLRNLFEVNGSAYTDINLYYGNQRTIQNVRLPSPYESNCIKYNETIPGFHDQYHCTEECVASEVWKTFRKVSLLSPVIETTQERHNETFSKTNLIEDDDTKKFWKIQKYCQSSQCHRKECRDIEVITNTEARNQRTKKGDSRVYHKRQLVLIHRILPQISFRITSTASLPFVEFVIYVLSTISTWTGLSIIACNPANLLAYFGKKSLPRKLTPQILNTVKRRRTQKLFLSRNLSLQVPRRGL